MQFSEITVAIAMYLQFAMWIHLSYVYDLSEHMHAEKYLHPAADRWLLSFLIFYVLSFFQFPWIYNQLGGFWSSDEFNEGEKVCIDDVFHDSLDFLWK